MDKTAVSAGTYVPVESDFRLKNNDDEIALDANFAAQGFWRDVFIRYVRKTSAVIGFFLIIIIGIIARR